MVNPLTKPPDHQLESLIEAAVPEKILSQRKETISVGLQTFLEKQKQEIPVFYMRGVASLPGQQVNLHFFEDRYKILIRRAWEGNKRFLCTQTQPAAGMTGLIVEVDEASFQSDGTADIRGRGVEVVTLGRVWTEEGTHGLFYSEPVSSEPCEHRAKRILIRGLRQGRPHLLSASMPLCMTIFLDSASHAVREAPNGAMSDCLQRAISDSHNSDPASAAKILLSGFHEALGLSALHDPTPGLVQLELPVFYTSSIPPPAVGQVIHLRLFERRYCVLAREVWANPERLFLFSDGDPRQGSEATIMRVQTSTWQQGATVNACLGIGTDKIWAVRRDAAKFDLFYASCTFPIDSLDWDPGQDDSPRKCCFLQ